MLDDLKAHHEAVRVAIVALRAEVERAVPDEAGLASARLRLGRASGRRKALIECSIFPTLHDAGPADQRRIADLRQEASANAVISAEHIARWTMPTIIADWPGYQAACRAMTADMTRRIADEAAFLYPLLAERERARAA